MGVGVMELLWMKADRSVWRSKRASKHREEAHDAFAIRVSRVCRLSRSGAGSTANRNARWR